MNAKKNVVITGASKGMGKVLVEKFHTAGNNILMCSRNEKELSALVRELKMKNTGNTITYHAADLSDKKQAIEFGRWVLQQEVPIDILINNAGQFLPGSIYNEEDGVFEKMLRYSFVGSGHWRPTDVVCAR